MVVGERRKGGEMRSSAAVRRKGVRRAARRCAASRGLNTGVSIDVTVLLLLAVRGGEEGGGGKEAEGGEEQGAV